MKLQIVDDSGKKLNMADITPEFIEKVAESSPVMGMILTMAKVKSVLAPEVKEEAPVTKEEEVETTAKCTGDSTTCPICGDSMLVGFAEALEEMENAGMVTRQAWINSGIDGHLSITPEIKDGAYTLEPYIAFVDFEEKTASPYTLTNDDILAKDWLLLQMN